MSENAAGARQEKGRAWQRNATRAKILAVARKMVDRDGVDLTSLNRVAEDAGFAPVTVYAYFPSINDLLISLLADDLAAMARAMRESYPFAEADDVAASSRDNPQTEPEVEPAPADNGRVPQVRKDRASLGERIRAALRKEPSGKFDLEPPQEPQEAPRVDAWLERRLRVFERSLAELESRFAETERTSQRAAAMASDGLSTLNQHFEALRKRDSEKGDAHIQRLDAVEKQHRDNIAELRVALKDTAGRLDVLESHVLGPAKPSIYLPADEATETGPEPTGDNPPVSAAETDISPDERHEPQPAPESGESFLSAARRAAKAAATLSQIEEKDRKRFDFSALTGRTRTLLVACAALLAMMAGAAIVLRSLPGNPGAAGLAAITPADASVGTGTTHIHLSVMGAHARIEKLAAAGDVKAELLMGLDSLNGEGTAKNNAVAAQWLARAAKSGDPIAEYWLAMLYAAGLGVTKDPATAVHLYEASATKGNRKAMHALAMAYATGQGVPQDYAAAARWFSRAADLGLVNSQFNLAVLYERGEGVPQSLLNAYKWYAVAAAQGDSESQARVDALATQLSPEDLGAAKQSVADFKPQRPNASANLVPRINSPAG